MNIDLDNWEKLPTQDIVYYDDSVDTLMFAAGLGSGKSHVLCRKMLKLSAINRGIAGGLLTPSFPEYKKDIEPLLEVELQEKLGMVEGKHYRYNRSEKKWTFCWSRAPLYVFTADRPIAGPNLGWGGVNEFSLIPKMRMNEFLRRMRVKNVPRKQTLLVGTPEDSYGYLEEFVENYKKMNEKNPNKFRLVHGSTLENKFIDETYADHLRGTLDARALEVFLSGQFGRMGDDYFYYAFQTDKNVTKSAVQVENLPVHIAMDFNVGRMTSTFWNKLGKTARCFGELLLKGNSDTPEMARAIRARFPDTQVILHVDASAKARKTSGRSDLQILQQDFGFTEIRYKAVNPAMRTRQLLVNGKLERKEIEIHPDCKTLITDLKSVKQLSDFTKDKKNIELTHASDGMDYLLDYEYPFDISKKSASIQL